MGDRIINTSGGNYNEIIQGNYIQGNYTENHREFNYINLQQDLSQIALDIQSLSSQLQKAGSTPVEAQQKIAQTLIATVKNNSSLKTRLLQLGEYLGNAAASGLIGEVAIEGVKLALRLLGCPI
jgi:hypothetical protein